MKLLQFILIAIFLLGGFASCKKWKGDENKEVKYGGGRVVLINSETPVPSALVRFTKWANSCLTCPMSYIEVGTDTTDESGHFDIPTDTDATMAIAFGVDSIYDRQSAEGNVTAYIENGGELKLSLVPPAWIKVSALDVEPLNPEIDYVKAHTSTGGYFPAVPIIDPQIWKVDGNTVQYIGYLLVYVDETSSDVIEYPIPPPLPFDTTEYVIEY